MLSSQDNILSYPPPPAMVYRQWNPNVEIAPNCPRCDSANTKFCYYNNYSLSQPRYFCKGCRRYWTKGGSLRNVPVGGGCRKSRRGKSSTRISIDGAAERGGLSSCQRLPPVNIRPDLALDGMVSNSCSLETMETKTDADSSTIDLAVLYAKYLNQCPAQSEPEVVVPELAGEFDQEPLSSVGSSLNDLSDQPHQQKLPIGEELLISHADYQNCIEELNPSLDPSNAFESLAIQMETDFFPSDCLDVPHLMPEAIRYQDFESLIPADSASLHHNILNGDQWSELEYPNLEAFYRP